MGEESALNKFTENLVLDVSKTSPYLAEWLRSKIDENIKDGLIKDEGQLKEFADMKMSLFLDRRFLLEHLNELYDKHVESKFDNVCPYDYRYIDEKLANCLSANAEQRYYVKVHIALMKGLVKFNKATEENVRDLENAFNKIKTSRIYYLEDKVTRHDQQAVTIHLKECGISEDTMKRDYPGTTSQDIIDPSRAMMYRDSVNDVIYPNGLKLLKTLLDKCELYSDRVQVGRTHGQHTSATMLGYALANYAQGLADRLPKLKNAANSLEGKISGIVGTYASPSVIIGLDNVIEFERYVLEDCLGLKVSPISSQVTRKEKLMDLGHYLTTLDGVLADLANSMRHLQRSEIREVGELAGEQRLGGSSADPSKSNPINFENVNGLWEVILSGMNTLYHLAVSDHQRDLRNSVMWRFEPTHIICGVNESLKRLDKVMSNLAVYPESMEENLAKASKYSNAEALNAILKAHYYLDAHDKVRKLTQKAKKAGKPLLETALQDGDIKYYWDNKFTEEEKLFLTDVKTYTGIAKKKTLDFVEKTRKEFGF